jgi:hypothetical protein
VALRARSCGFWASFLENLKFNKIRMEIMAKSRVRTHALRNK